MSSERHLRIKEVFLAACRLAPGERSGLLGEACGDDDELRREVESLLAHHDDTAPDDPSPDPDDRIDDYRLLQRIGEGGMGEVYEAEQLRPIRRRVALKLIKPGMDTREVIGRFESERQALALMSHPSIARVFDAGTTSEGRPYFAMEFVRGVPITDYCDRQRLTTRDRLRLFVEVCHGLQHAHQKGVIHRDVKPSNVLVAREGGRPVPKIIDFGVAKAIAQRLTDRTLYTTLGQPIGTPEYMSPEQAEPSGLDIDTRSDVYSLGVLLYELLIGVRPFEARGPDRAGLEEMRRRIREEEPTRPSTKVAQLGERSAAAARNRRTDPSSLARQLRGDLDWIVVRALDKDPARRYGSPAELAADVDRHLASEPVLAGPPSALYRAGKFVRRHRVGVAAGSVAAAALLLGSAAATVGLLRARQEAESARRASEFLAGMVYQLDPFSDRTFTDPETLLETTLERIDRELGDQPLIRAQLLKSLGAVYTSRGLYGKARPMLEEAVETFRSICGSRDPAVADGLLELGWCLIRAGEFEASLELYREAVAIRRQALPRGDPAIGVALAALGFAQWSMGDHAEAEATLAEALAIQESAPQPDLLPLTRTLYVQGINSLDRGDYAAARRAHERALRIREELLGRDHARVGWSLFNLAMVDNREGLDDEAESRWRRSLAILEKAFGPDHPDVSFPLQSLGNLERSRGRLDEARRLLERALAIREGALGTDHAALAHSLMSLGWLEIDAGDLPAARARFERASEVAREHVPPGHQTVGWTLNGLAVVTRLEGDLAAARPLQERALGNLERTLGPGHPELGWPLTGMGLVLEQTGDLEAAGRHLERALAIRERALGPTHPEVAESLRRLAHLREQTGEVEEAHRLLRRALEISEKALGADHPATVRARRDLERLQP